MKMVDAWWFPLDDPILEFFPLMLTNRYDTDIMMNDDDRLYMLLTS